MAMFDGFVRKILPLSREALGPILDWTTGYPWGCRDRSELAQFDGSLHVEHVGYFPQLRNPELFQACGSAIRDLQTLSWLADCDPVYVIAARLQPGAVVKTHYDVRKRHELSFRVHIPLSPSPQTQYLFSASPVEPPPGTRLLSYFNSVRMEAAFEMEHGSAYLFNNRCLHQVRHLGQVDRTNIFMDFLPRRFRGLSARQLEEKQPQTERERLCLSTSSSLPA